MSNVAPISPPPGQCESCSYAHIIISGKGSQFFYCTRAEIDTRYPKYPRLPVVECPGYKARSSPQQVQ